MMQRFRTAGVATALIATLAACSEPTPGVERGQALFDTCVPCHGANGQGNQVLGAPAIAGLPQWYVEAQLEKYQTGWRGAHPMDTVGIRMKSMTSTSTSSCWASPLCSKAGRAWWPSASFAATRATWA